MPYTTHALSWDVEYTDEFEEWWNDLEMDDQDAIFVAVGLLADRGPALGRPLVDQIKSSKYKNMKELIPPASDIRVLFAFDPRRTAILLIGGNKAGEWDKWYEEFVPKADGLYDDHLETLKKEAEEAKHAKDT
jgi:hypothetical protein